MTATERPSTEPVSSCRVCGTSHARFRCSTCKARWYCSPKCQKYDWKRHHQQECRALQAQQELTQLMMTGCSLPDAIKDFYQASDYVKDLTEDNDKGTGAIQQTQKVPATEHTELETHEPQHLRSSHQESLGPQPLSMTPRSLPNNVQPSKLIKLISDISDDSSNQSTCTWPNLDCNFQDMSHLMCYQLLLRGLPSLDHLETKLQPCQYGDSTIFSLKSMNHVLLSLCLARRIQHTQSIVEENGTALSIRLSYQRTGESLSSALSYTDELPFTVITKESMTTLSCRCCQQPLFDDLYSIHRVLPIPSGRWEDMTDYLMCYPGQPMHDLGASPMDVISELQQQPEESKNHLCWQDATSVIVPMDALHKDMTSVLAITGYGEDPQHDRDASSVISTTTTTTITENGNPSALMRGSRPWREQVGGATLTCGMCASVLGFALPTVARILKHRVQWEQQVQQQQTSKDSGAVVTMMETASIVEFLIHEMIRYVDTMAIFAFNIRKQDSHQHLWLRLVRWDGTGATNNELMEMKQKDTGCLDMCHGVEWKRLVQILFEETTEHTTTTLDGQNEPTVAWWAGDWCCAVEGRPQETKTLPTEKNRPNSVVCLCLEAVEWDELKETLDNASSFYSQDVKQATILAKMGKPCPSANLAAILLQS